MKKVLHVGAKNYPPAHGGTERVVFNIINGISDAEFYLLVEWEQSENEHIKILPKEIGYYAKAKYILKFARENKIDIIHFHNEKYIPMALLLSVVFRKIVLTVHGVHFRSPKFSWGNRIGFLLVDTIGAMFLPRMVFCAEYDQKAFDKIVFFRKTYFINNGADISEKGQNPSDIEFPDTYVFLGRITPAKNILKLIEAADKSKASIHLYGVFDKELEEYTALVKLKLKESKYVEYKGSVKYNEVPLVLKKYKAFLYVTVMEGLPLAVLEAASCGLFLVLSDIPHHRILKFPKVVYLDPRDFLLPTINANENGQENREHMIRNFSTEKMANEYDALYNSLMK